MSLQVNITKKLKGFTLRMAFDTDRECLGILGASGCGKSMTLKCIAGIEKPDEGRIILNGRVLFDSEKKINLSPRERRVGYLFQNYALFPNLTVYDNIKAGLTLPREQIPDRVRELMKIFRLDGLEKRYPRQLSGGQQQRVALARCLAYEPEVLMLDEPFSALDEYLKENLQIQMKAILDQYQGDILMVTHSREEVYRFCSRIAIVHNGHVAAMGETRAIFQNPCHVTAARLSGCKNISRIEKLGEYRIRALDWNINLKTLVPVTDDMKYVGIRAHDLVPAAEKTDSFSDNRENGIEDAKIQSIELNLEPDSSRLMDDKRKTEDNLAVCREPELTDGLFEEVILFPTGSTPESVLWWKVSRDEWKKRYREKVPGAFYLPAEALMLLSED